MKRLFKASLILFLINGILFANELRTTGSPADGKKKDSNNQLNSNPEEPLRVGVIGLVHDHVGWILGREKTGDIEIVAIVESNRDLASRYCKKYGYPLDMIFKSTEEMLESKHPDAVTAFNAISEHVTVVELCAPRGIHVMVEKPLSTTLKDANRMIALAKKHHILLLTNYETTWYGSNKEAYDIVHKEKKIGDIRRINFQTGHKGPIEIGCTPEFLAWLTDPVLNGGGALTDFGCYGANLATWYMMGETPQTVSCVTQHIKPELYPKVEDEATIILTYPEAQVLIQASWNWSYGRKDMEIYGKTGSVICKNNEDMLVMENEEDGYRSLKANPLPKGIHDPFSFYAKVIKENYLVEPFSPSSMENNKVVIQILEAAKQSAKTGRAVVWDAFFNQTNSRQE